MATRRKTPIAARELGISYHRLSFLIRSGHIRAPEKDTSGDYWWTDADLDGVRQYLEARDRRRAGAAQEVAGAK
jgi:hypothetical protein